MDRVTAGDGAAKRQAIDDLKHDHWIVPLGRYVIEDYSTSRDFGAVIAFAAVCAWRDRGPGWGPGEGEDFKRLSAQTPPGGWPALAGVTAPTWRKRRDRAIEIGLIERRTGEDADGREIALLEPLVNVEEGEQFARVPAAILFHKGLSKTGKRVYCALAMHRTGTGWARAAKATIGTLAGLDRADVSRGLKELVGAGALIETGDARTGKVRRWVMPHDYSDLLKTPQSPVNNPTPAERNPTVACKKPHGDLLKTPQSPVNNPPPIKNPFQESSQESNSGDSGQSPGVVLIDDDEGGKEQPPQDDRQREAAQAPPLTMPLVGLADYTGGANGRVRAIADKAVKIITDERTSAEEAEAATAQLVVCEELLKRTAA